MAKFRVMREHVGDHPYKEGEEREANAAEVAHLVPNTLQPMIDGDKAEVDDDDLFTEAKDSGEGAEVTEEVEKTERRPLNKAERRSRNK